jgi:hypothetical protein
MDPDPEPIGPEKKIRETSCFFVRKKKVLTNFFPSSRSHYHYHYHSAQRQRGASPSPLAPEYLSVDTCSKKKNFVGGNNFHPYPQQCQCSHAATEQSQRFKRSSARDFFEIICFVSVKITGILQYKKIGEYFAPYLRA